MKSLFAGAAALLVAAVAAPAFAQTEAAPSVYANLGGNLLHGSDGDLWTLQGRVGVRAFKYVGVEGEGAFGLNTLEDTGTKVKIRSQFAGYGVAFLPVQPNFDVLARVGYGHTSLRVTDSGLTATGGLDSVNYGVGAQYFMGKNGLRFDYTRVDFRKDDQGALNSFALSYVRNF